MEVLNELVQVVSRLFYEEQHVIIMDIMLLDRVLLDEIIAHKIKLIPREASKFIAKLKDDHMLSVLVRNEKTPEGKTLTRSYYYIDYKKFVDMVKFKIYKIRKNLESMMTNETENKSYFCPSCDKSFGLLEVDSLIDPSTFLFHCDFCSTELQEKVKVKSQSEADLNHKRFMEQCGSIIELLKQTEKITLPLFVPSVWLDSAVGKEANIPKENTAIRVKKLAKPQIGPTSKISVHFGEASMKNDNVPAAKLPEWHTRSTVTGAKIVEEGSNSQSVSQIKSTFYSYLESLPKSPEFDLKNMESVPSAAQQNECFVMVRGEKVRIQDITEDHKASMTEEEYLVFLTNLLDLL